MRICNAYKECSNLTCHHRLPHNCTNKGMHISTTCYDSKIISVCVPVFDNKIKVVKIEKCPCCGHETRKGLEDEDVDMSIAINGPTFHPGLKGGDSA